MNRPPGLIDKLSEVFSVDYNSIKSGYFFVYIVAPVTPARGQDKMLDGCVPTVGEYFTIAEKAYTT